MDDLKNQLHEQYATNANSNVSAMLTLATSLLVVFTTYGYVLMNCVNLKAIIYGSGMKEDGLYSSNALMLTAMAVMFVLAVLYCVALYLGSYQRLEQFITYAIRKDRAHNPSELKFLPEKYSPFDKKRCNFVQGLHGISMAIYTILFFVIVMTTSIVAYLPNCSFDCNCYTMKTRECGPTCTIQILFWLIVAFSVAKCCCYTKKRYRKYKERENEYIEKGYK